MDNITYLCDDCGKFFDTKEKASACCNEGFREVSECCHAEIGARTVTERDRHIEIVYQVDCCTDCGERVELE